MIRLMKDNRVEVYFEKENIWTFDSKGEMLLTIMSSIARRSPGPYLRTFPGECRGGSRKGSTR